VIYCLVPKAADEELFESLTEQFGASPQVKVIRENRTPASAASPAAQQRHITVPRRLWLSDEHAALGVRLEEWLSSVSEDHADQSLAEVAGAAALGDSDSAAELYWRLYERMLPFMPARVQDVGEIFRPAFGRLLDIIAGPNALPVDIEDTMRHLVLAIGASVAAEAERSMAFDPRAYRSAVA
jgi:hypothetical protein